MSRSPRISRRRWAAAVSCSRPVVDAKWMDKSRQVGSSGQTVRPKVYLACGISGSFQHLAGLKGNPFLVAINKNPNAPIFRVADVGIVADILEFLPAVGREGARREVRSRQGRTLMIAKKTLKLSLKSLRDFAKKRLPDQELIDLDERDECPLEIVRHMCSPDKLGIQLLFIPEEYGGFGGGAFDVYCICEEMARIDLGIATAVLATFLGSDPITVGATPEQKKLWLTRIAEEGVLFAYGATEPDAGSDLGALQTTAERVMKDGRIAGYQINGSKQWISNGGIADVYTVLANTPGGPELVRRGEGRAGIRSRQAGEQARHSHQQYGGAVIQQCLCGRRPADRRRGRPGPDSGAGGVRLYAADGGGVRAGRRVGGARSRDSLFRRSGFRPGAPLSEKQGYTHKLIVPNVARLEAARALHRRDGGADRFRRREPQHRRRDRQVHGHGGGQSRGRREHPGAGRVRLHARVHGGEDQARRPHHHDLRRHLRDHGDDHRARPLAAPLENARPALLRPGARLRSTAREPSGGRRESRGPGPASARRSHGEGARRRGSRGISTFSCGSGN